MLKGMAAARVWVCLGVLACAGCQPAEYRTGGGPGNDEPSSCEEPGPVPSEVARELDLDRGFYAQHCAVFGIPILGSAEVSQPALQEAGRLVQGVLEGHTELRDALHDRYFRVVVVASNAGEQLKDVPELADLRDVENRAAGLGPDPEFPAATVRDSTILCRPRTQDPGATPPGDTLVHELGHAILSMGLDAIEPGFRKRLHAAFDTANDDARWQLNMPADVEVLYPGQPTDNYLMTDPDEYWATGVSAWFGLKPIPVGYRLTEDAPPQLALEVIYGRDSLEAHDPELSALLEEVFGAEQTLPHGCPQWIPALASD
jgi:hypothetical protein